MISLRFTVFLPGSWRRYSAWSEYQAGQSYASIRREVLQRVGKGYEGVRLYSIVIVTILTQGY